jgi:hypothetical protein
MDPNKRKRLEDKGYIISDTPQQWLGLTNEDMLEIDRRIQNDQKEKKDADNQAGHQ